MTLGGKAWLVCLQLLRDKQPRTAIFQHRVIPIGHSSNAVKNLTSIYTVQLITDSLLVFELIKRLGDDYIQRFYRSWGGW